VVTDVLLALTVIYLVEVGDLLLETPDPLVAEPRFLLVRRIIAFPFVAYGFYSLFGSIIQLIIY
jgi:hypothetical protein